MPGSSCESVVVVDAVVEVVVVEVVVVEGVADEDVVVEAVVGAGAVAAARTAFVSEVGVAVVLEPQPASATASVEPVASATDSD